MSKRPFANASLAMTHVAMPSKRCRRNVALDCHQTIRRPPATTAKLGGTRKRKRAACTDFFMPNEMLAATNAAAQKTHDPMPVYLGVGVGIDDEDDDQMSVDLVKPYTNMTLTVANVRYATPRTIADAFAMQSRIVATPRTHSTSPTRQCVRFDHLRQQRNGHRSLSDWLRADRNHIYVGGDCVHIEGAVRSKWSNPFTDATVSAMTLRRQTDGGCCSGDLSLARYRAWIVESPQRRGELQELKSCTLGCWCATSTMCHARILVDLVNDALTSS